MQTIMVAVTLKTGVTMHGPIGLCVQWLAEQASYRPGEVLPATVGLSPYTAAVQQGLSAAAAAAVGELFLAK